MARQAAGSRPVVVVCGDGVVDWNISMPVRDGHPPFSLRLASRSFFSWHRGGAMMLADLIDLVADELRRAGKDDFDVRSISPPKTDFLPSGAERFHHAFALFEPFGDDVDAPPGHAGAWRVREFLGFDPSAQRATDVDQLRVVDDSAGAALVVLDDSGLGFRDRQELWPGAIKEAGRTPWVLVKMGGRVEGRLWERLAGSHADRLVVVTTADYLRRGGMFVSRELSWERTAEDLVRELVNSPRPGALARCAHTVISFGPVGAFLLSRLGAWHEAGTPPFRCTIVFDPALVEGMWEEHHPGMITGYVATLTGAIARQLMLAPDGPDMVEGVRSGLAAMREVWRVGFGEDCPGADHCRLRYPLQVAANAFAGSGASHGDFAVAEVPWSFPEGSWTIMGSRYPGNLDSLAEDIVVQGPQAALRDVPLGRFHDLLSVDRHEIESLRSIRSLMVEYCRRQADVKPLSIAVFGPPGGGKSFGVEQIALSMSSASIKSLEPFNLSQFASSSSLVGAFHLVRDTSLRGHVPLVFWDEFDTQFDGQALGWLRYFLAPMQDGTFQEGQIVHPIGRSVFVFAGGTVSRMKDFGADMGPREFARVKGPDFLSRLRGYIDVRGPNPEVSAEEDRYAIVRRAIVLRSLLRRQSETLFENDAESGRLRIDPGVLRAFLHTHEYRHGARSMGAIVSMSKLAGRTAFEQSCLPAVAQLDLHVDGEDFLSIMRQARAGEPAATSTAGATEQP